MAEPDAAQQSSSSGAAAVDDTDDIETGNHNSRCCPVCTEPAEWVAIGPCGHREVCVNCAVRMRFFNKNLRCSICRAFCPTVVITKAVADEQRDGDDTFSRPSTAFGGAGRVGVYFWFHGGAAAYFDNQEQYEAVRKMCLRSDPSAAREEACVDPIPSTAFGGAGQVGVYFWFHGGAAAYFDNQEQYEAVRQMCLRRDPSSSSSSSSSSVRHQEASCCGADPAFVLYVVAITLVGTASITPMIIDLERWYHRVGVVLGSHTNK
ncbi:hypothetical protein EJB05_56603, partial [Eragrostis curvula]